MELVPFLLSLAAGLGYTLSALFSKRALSGGAGVMRIFFVGNWMFFAAALFLLVFDHHVVDWGAIGPAILCGALRFIGLILVFYTIRVGDVSLQVPLIGTKVIFVALTVWMLGASGLDRSIWIAALLTVIGIALMSKVDATTKDPGRILKTVILGVTSAVFFGTNDALVQVASPKFGNVPFMAVSAGTTAIASLAIMPFFRTRLDEISRATWRWLLIGAALLGVEVVMLFCAISFYNAGAAANIVYNTRSLWTIVFVWFAGHWFDNKEREVGGKMMLRRLMGAGLLLLAVALVIA